MENEIKKYRHFFNNTTIRLGLCGWHIRFVRNSSEGFCNKNTKIITIGLNHSYIKQLILHEVAHINTCRFCNQKHNPTFWKTFERLMEKFLPDQKICDSEKSHMKYMTNGFYSL